MPSQQNYYLLLLKCQTNENSMGVLWVTYILYHILNIIKHE